MKIVVTIPAYNEGKMIGKVINDIKQVMKKEKYRYEILVIDDGSTDDTAKIAKKAGAKVYSHPHNYGLAEAFRTEISKSLQNKADLIVHIDADGQYRAAEIPKLIKPITKKEADLVLGSRFMGTIEEMPFMKRLGNKVFSRAISGIIKTRITDCQTGFRAFTKKVAENIKIISDHTYTQEQIIKTNVEKFKIKEVPIYFDKRKDGKSRLLSNPFEYALKAWTNLFRIYRDYAPLKFFGPVGVSLILISAIIGIFILREFFLFGPVGPYQKLPTIMLMILIFIAGLNILFFGFFADMKKN